MSLQLEGCSLEELCIARGGTMALLDEQRDRLRDWLRQQPHLPQEIMDDILNHVIIHCKHSLEKSKKVLDMFFTIRNLVPEIYHNRDPSSESIKRTCDSIAWFYSPKLTPEKYRVCVSKLLDGDPQKYNTYDLFKIGYMISDISMSEFLGLGDVFVVDFSLFQLNHLIKVSPAALKKCEVIATKVYAVKIKGIHFLNAPSFVDRLAQLIKSVLKPKLATRIYIHDSIESLHKYVPKSVLPVDYGGEQPSMLELKEKWYEKLMEWRDWFLNEGNATVDESLRPEQTIDYDELFGLNGSFRKLEVD